MKQRKILPSLVLLLLMGIQFLPLLTCNAEEIPIPKVQADVYVYDSANLLDETAVAKLNNMFIDLEEKTEVEFAVVTVESLQGNDLESYSAKVANELGVGKKDQDNGLLLFIAKSEKRVRLEVGKGLEGILNDGKCGRILDEFFVPYRDKDEYVKATELTAQAIINAIAEDMEVTIDGVDPEVLTEDESMPGWLIIVIVVVFLIGGIIVVVVGDDSDGSGSSGSGGSFTSSSFGGSSFGGGGFGGGGASR